MNRISTPTKPLYDHIAEATGVDREHVKKVLHAFSYSSSTSVNDQAVAELTRIADALEKLASCVGDNYAEGNNFRVDTGE